MINFFKKLKGIYKWHFPFIPQFNFSPNAEFMESDVFNQDAFLKTSSEILNIFPHIEKDIAVFGKNQKRWYLKGKCEVCGKPRRFMIDWMHSDGINLNFRESFVCNHCFLNNRQRFMFAKIQKLVNDNSNFRSVYLFEQTTPFYFQIKKKMQTEVVGSEYLGFDKRSGEIYQGIRHEDAMNLSFNNERFNIVVSNDVFEHVPDFNRALSEIFRVLKPNGFLMFSIPFYAHNLKTITRARLTNGVVECLLPAQFHGNLVDAKGSMVFHDFGWDVLDDCTKAGFVNSHGILFYSPSYGYLGEGGQMIFIAHKPY